MNAFGVGGTDGVGLNGTVKSYHEYESLVMNDWSESCDYDPCDFGCDICSNRACPELRVEH